MKEKSILLENPDYLKKINPWNIDLTKEINLIYNILKKRLNLVIAGVAADNASLIYSRKIDTIEAIYRRRRQRYSEYEEILIPDIRIQYGTGRSLIDISDLIDIIDEIIRARISREREEEVHIEIEPYSYIEEEIRKASDEIKSLIRMIKGPILFSDLIKKVRKFSPLMIFYVILYLYIDEFIDIETLEDDEGIVIDIVIQRIR
ncbi:hypothetical protein DRN87_01225 [Candidatus Geothermarchaeota archaeon]|nr:MAG: hypothetical protein DRN87_01225 [Candidatus Geothermarchaeota archaeon]HEW93477.1 hypothetical protein [Thermoprotei archaeon]